MSQSLKLAALLPLKRGEYIRGKLDEKNLERLRAVRDAGREWPFPPIQVRKLDKPKKVKGVEYGYAIFDGEHRRFLAGEAKRTEILVDVVKVTPAMADLEALRKNLEHGALIDKKKRGPWVKRLVKVHKMKVPGIAKLLHMTPRSVYRMVAGTDVKVGPRKKASKKDKGGEGNGEGTVSWSVEQFFTSLAAVSKEARKHADAVQTFYKAHKDKLAPVVDPLLEVLQ